MIGYVVLIIYTMGNIAAYMLYRRERRSEFSSGLHGLFPLLSTLGHGRSSCCSRSNIIGGDPLGFQPDSGRCRTRRSTIAVIFVGVWFIVGLVLVAVPALERSRGLDAGGRRGRLRASRDAGGDRGAQGRVVIATA